MSLDVLIYNVSTLCYWSTGMRSEINLSCKTRFKEHVTSHAWDIHIISLHFWSLDIVHGCIAEKC